MAFTVTMEHQMGTMGGVEAMQQTLNLVAQILQQQQAQTAQRMAIEDQLVKKQEIAN